MFVGQAELLIKTCKSISCQKSVKVSDRQTIPELSFLLLLLCFFIFLLIFRLILLPSLMTNVFIDLLKAFALAYPVPVLRNFVAIARFLNGSVPLCSPVLGDFTPQRHAFRT
jgi:hypothetical protein